MLRTAIPRQTAPRRRFAFPSPTKLVAFLAVVLTFKTTIGIVLGYADYLPPDFRADFLLGRQRYFFGAYAWAFYAHIAVGPFCLLSGLVLLSDRFRRWRPAWHRRIGKAHLLAVLAVLAPSGLWMSAYAMGGPAAGSAFALQSLATAAFAGLGWRAAVRRRFAEHRRWMQRLSAVLVSAVVIRVIGGLSELLGWTEAYPIAAWTSWLVPLAVLELWRPTSPRPHRLQQLSTRLAAHRD